MKRVMTVVACCSILAAAAGPVPAAEPVAQVRVFEASELTLDRYTVIERIWVESWRSAFWMPAHNDPADAISALTSKAARLGADGVTNLYCLDDRGGVWFARGYFCYGLAIKLK